MPSRHEGIPILGSTSLTYSRASRAVNTTLYPSAVSRQGSRHNNTCKIKKNLTPRWVGGHQAHPLFVLIYPKPGFDKASLGTSFVPSTVHTKVKTSTPVCPQGVPLTWQLNAALSQHPRTRCTAGPQYGTDAPDSWILRRHAPTARPLRSAQVERKARAGSRRFCADPSNC